MSDNKFTYTYSAPTESERREIESIKNQYSSSGSAPSWLERLRRLDARVKNFAAILSISVGIVGVLSFGFGLSAVLEWKRYALGIPFALVGAAVAALALPVHRLALARGKRKYGAEILRLSEELLNGDE